MSRPLLLGCQDVAKSYGTRDLFDRLSFGIFEGDRACLVGPNGSGKSTLLKILAGVESPDRGVRSVRSGVRVGYVAQDPVFPAGAAIEDVMVAALGHVDADDRPGRIAQALGRAGFNDTHADIDELSGG
jgi:ATPase subunit of ABC transporter with duplicated ATPase domains